MTTVQHRLLDTSGTPIPYQDITVMLMVRKDILRDGYRRTAPLNDSFGGMVASQIVSTSDTEGYLSWELVPNEQIVPSGTYYQVVGLGPERILLWVHDSPAPVDMDECRIGLIDYNSSNLVVLRGPRGKNGTNVEAAQVAAQVATQTATDVATQTAQAALSTKVNSATYTAGLATKQDKSTLVADVTKGLAKVAATGSYNDLADKPTITAGTSYTDEQARDAIGSALVGIGNIGVFANDAVDTITISTTATVNATDGQLRDRSTHTGTQPANTVTGLATVATTGAYTDLTGKPTIPAAYTDEQVRDVMGVTLVAGSNVTITPDDARDTITIAATATGGAAANPFDNTGATDCTAAIQAAINAIKVNGGVITFAPGTYRIDGQLNADNSYNVVLRGLGAQGSDRNGRWNTTLSFTKSGNLACVSARNSQGFTIDNLALIPNNTAYTGSIVDVGSVGDPTPTYRCTFRNGYIGGPGGTTATARSAYAAIWLGQVVEAVIENMVIGRCQNGLIGRSSAEPTFSNVITMVGGRFTDIANAAILNPYINWTLINVVFEPNLAGAPAGIVCTAAYPAEVVTLIGVNFWDITAPGIWIDYWGNGLTMVGHFAAVYGGSTFVRLNGRVEGYSATGGTIWGSSSDRYMALGSGASVFYVTANDRFWGGIGNNVPSLMRSLAMNASYQPTLKVRNIGPGTTQLGLFDCGSILICNASGGQVDLLLPNAADSPGSTITVKKDDASSGYVQANGFYLTGQNWSRTFVSDGSRWHTTAMVGNSGI